MTKKVRLVQADDWVALYIDGLWIEEGHHIQLDDLAKYLGCDVKEVWLDDDVAEDFFSDTPMSLTDEEFQELNRG